MGRSAGMIGMSELLNYMAVVENSLDAVARRTLVPMEQATEHTLGDTLELQCYPTKERRPTHCEWLRVGFTGRG